MMSFSVENINQAEKIHQPPLWTMTLTRLVGINPKDQIRRASVLPVCKDDDEIERDYLHALKCA